MRKNVAAAVLICTLVVVLPPTPSATTVGLQWSALAKITDGLWFMGSSYSRPVISANGQHIYVAWMDGRDSLNQDYDLYLTDSLNGGLSWSRERRVDTQGTYGSRLQIFSDDNFVHIFLGDGPGFFHLKSPDQGQTWTKSQFASLPVPAACLEDYSATVNLTNLFFAWSSKSTCSPSDEYEVWFTKSPDNGDTWEQPREVWHGTTSSGHAHLDLSYSDGRVYLVFDQGFLKSDDGGNLWGLIDPVAHGMDVEATGRYVYVATGNAYGFQGLRKSSDYGNSWSAQNSSIRGWLAAKGTVAFATFIPNYFLSTDSGASFVWGIIPGAGMIGGDADYLISSAADSEGNIHVALAQFQDRLEFYYDKLTINQNEPTTSNFLGTNLGTVLIVSAGAVALALLAMVVPKLRRPRQPVASRGPAKPEDPHDIGP